MGPFSPSSLPAVGPPVNFKSSRGKEPSQQQRVWFQTRARKDKEDHFPAWWATGSRLARSRQHKLVAEYGKEEPFFQGWLVSGCVQYILLHSQGNLLRLDFVTGSDCRWIFSKISRWASPWFLTQTFTVKDGYWSWWQFVCSMTSAGGFLHANISVVLGLAHKWHHRADAGKRLCMSTTSTQPQDCVTAALLSHSTNLLALCAPASGSAAVVAPVRPFPAAALVPGVSLCKSWTNQDLMMQKYTPKRGASWCQWTLIMPPEMPVSLPEAKPLSRCLPALSFL